jgi:hypothetical protein
MLLDAVAGTLILTETSANRHAVTPFSNHDLVEACSIHVASVELFTVAVLKGRKYLLCRWCKIRSSEKLYPECQHMLLEQDLVD